MRNLPCKRSLRLPILAALTSCLCAFGEVSDKVDEIYREAQRAAADGDLSGAITVLEEAVVLEPRSPIVNHYLARLLIRSQRLEEAETAIGRLLEFRPEEGQSLYLLGLIALAREDSTAALDHFEKALADPRRKKMP